MGDLSKNFSEWEFSCLHCEEIDIDMELVNALEELRSFAGDMRVSIISGYRCVEQNRIAGGTPRSQHRKGKAADVRIDSRTPLEIFILAHRIEPFCSGGIGLYPRKYKPGFVHVDVRKKVARWGRVEGEYVPWHDAVNFYLRHCGKV